jgi:Zn-dependent peptidase ImmA (M78 family)/DNA-binding XRE family transcriptional regulator
MESVIGKRIHSARKMAGLSLRKLAEKVDADISHTSIRKFEKGQLVPDSETLSVLAKALNVRPDYFFKPFEVEINKVEFRKKSKLGKRKIQSIQELIKHNIENYLELEALMDIPTSFENPIQGIQIGSGKEVEKAVAIIRENWDLGLNALPNVIELLEDHEIKVLELPLEDKFDGFSGFANGSIPIIVINKSYPVDRKRFTALHELGHLLLSFHENLTDTQIEKLCHRFAGSMLLSPEILRRELGNNRKRISLNELIAIKENFGISIQAIMARAKDLEIINKNTYRKFCIWIRQSEDRRQEKDLGEFKGEETSKRFKQLLSRATAEDLISFSKAASLADMRLAKYREEFQLV